MEAGRNEPENQGGELRGIDILHIPEHGQNHMAAFISIVQSSLGGVDIQGAPRDVHRSEHRAFGTEKIVNIPPHYRLY